jgi:hypothetical protein
MLIRYIVFLVTLLFLPACFEKSSYAPSEHVSVKAATITKCINAPICKKRYQLVHSMNTDESPETKEFIKLMMQTLSEVPSITHGKVSDYDVQKYLEKRVPVLMQTKEGQMQIICDLEKLTSIPIIRYESMNQIIEENGGNAENLTFNLQLEVERRTNPLVNKIVQEFKANIYA